MRALTSIPRSLRLAMVAVMALTIVAAAPVAAVTDGELDGNDHPFVWLMGAQDGDVNPLWRCSGTLL